MASEDRWQVATHDGYKTIADAGLDESEWIPCGACGERPRVWIFNNGTFAKCLCGHKYDPAPVEVEDVLSFFRRTDGMEGYYKGKELLLRAWNEHVGVVTVHERALASRLRAAAKEVGP